MFKKKLKIVQFAATATDQFFFTVGLGNDGQVYLWDKLKCEWVLHKQEAPVMPPVGVPNV